MPKTTDLLTMWLWPCIMAQVHLDLLETLVSARDVVAARLPTIATALCDPRRADAAELMRMVTEKSDAFGSSQRAVSAAARTVQTASEANARDLGKLIGGTPLGPSEWTRMMDRNLAAVLVLAALPAAALAPVHRRVSANARRLRR